jgi:hypothetical protein
MACAISSEKGSVRIVEGRMRLLFAVGKVISTVEGADMGAG